MPPISAGGGVPPVAGGRDLRALPPSWVVLGRSLGCGTCSPALRAVSLVGSPWLVTPTFVSGRGPLELLPSGLEPRAFIPGWDASAPLLCRWPSALSPCMWAI